MSLDGAVVAVLIVVAGAVLVLTLVLLRGNDTETRR